MKYYRLKHDTPETKKGTIFKKQGGFYVPLNGTQDYRHDDMSYTLGMSIKCVETMPYWFEEVAPVTPEFEPVEKAKK